MVITNVLKHSLAMLSFIVLCHTSGIVFAYSFCTFVHNSQCRFRQHSAVDQLHYGNNIIKHMKSVGI